MKTFDEFAEENGTSIRDDDAYDKYHEYFRDNAKVGDGVTVCLWTDSHAYTIVKRTAKTLTLRRCNAIRTDKNGMSDCQDYRYEENENGSIVRVYWSDKRKRFFDGSCVVVPGRHEYFDYSF